MREIPEREILKRLTFDNPWWDRRRGIDREVKKYPRRAYFDLFVKLVSDSKAKRAVILLGPRRVGKTVMIQQTVQSLIDEGVDGRSILLVALDTPTYGGLSLEKLVHLFQDQHSHRRGKKLYVFFDEIQYLTDWETHLKSLVDSYPRIRFVASGSAAAALRLKSRESGAGRFTDFLLPPLTFSEFLAFTGKDNRVQGRATEKGYGLNRKNIVDLNKSFVEYLNYGGFPEAVFSRDVQFDFQRFVGSDILDKVLLRDLPSLYGIADTRELNRLFATLAYNTGDEVNLEGLSQSCGIAKNTLRRYLEYLEAAFLIQRVHRVDQNARRFKRAVTFKVYLTNPCLRAALFGAVGPDDEAMGRLAETSVYSQIFNSSSPETVHYARWATGEVDVVVLNPATQEPDMVFEVKWSDRVEKSTSEFAPLVAFCEKVDLKENKAIILTRSVGGEITISGRKFPYIPVSTACYILGKQTVESYLRQGIHPHSLFPVASSNPSRAPGRAGAGGAR